MCGRHTDVLAKWVGGEREGKEEKLGKGGGRRSSLNLKFPSCAVSFKKNY